MHTTTRCPSLGTLRAHLDVDDPDVGHHLDDCDECRATILTVAADAGRVRRLLATLDAPEEVLPATAAPPARAGVVLPSTSGSSAGTRPPSRRSGRGGDRRRARGRPSRGRGALVGGVLVAALALTVGQPVVAQVLDRFRTEQVRPLLVDPGSLAGELAALDAVAEVTELTGERVAGGIDQLGAAADLAGVPVPDLAALGDAGDQRVRATSELGVRLSFRDGDDVPARLRGAVVEAIAPGTMVVHVEGAADGGDLVVASSRAIEVTATGVSLDDARDALLTEVDLPADLRDQLAAMEDWRTTLPVPVPVDLATWEPVDVDGVRGFAIGQGEVGMVVWQDGDVIHAIGGERGVDELLRLAGRL